MTTSIGTTPRGRARTRTPRWWIIRSATVTLGLLLAGAGFMTWQMNYVPGDLDTATTRTTSNGTYRVSYAPSSAPVPINELHTWALRVTTPGGKGVERATIAVDGDMPQHGHGLPTSPRVTQDMGGGEYLVEGVRFQMGGWWVMDFEITADDGSDTVRFDLVIDR